MYTAPTRAPQTPRVKGGERKYSGEIRKERPCDDEEDCEEGSGVDPNTTEDIFVTSVTGGCIINQ